MPCICPGHRYWLHFTQNQPILLNITSVLFDINLMHRRSADVTTSYVNCYIFKVGPDKYVHVHVVINWCVTYFSQILAWWNWKRWIFRQENLIFINLFWPTCWTHRGGPMAIVCLYLSVCNFSRKPFIGFLTGAGERKAVLNVYIYT